MSRDDETVMVRITGRVQGVAFRAWTRQVAQRLGLTGWVRNEPDGSVVALLSGPDAAVSDMLERLWQGPPSASVADVQRLPVEATENLPDFRILK
jgi:acylphosphatase